MALNFGDEDEILNRKKKFRFVDMSPRLLFTFNSTSYEIEPDNIVKGIFRNVSLYLNPISLLRAKYKPEKPCSINANLGNHGAASPVPNN